MSCECVSVCVPGKARAARPPRPKDRKNERMKEREGLGANALSHTLTPLLSHRVRHQRRGRAPRLAARMPLARLTGRAWRGAVTPARRRPLPVRGAVSSSALQSQPPPHPAVEVARLEAAARLRADAAAKASVSPAAASAAAAAAAAFEDREGGAAAYEAALSGLAAALGLDSPPSALPLARAQPGLLTLPRSVLIARLLALRACLPPGVDAAALATRAPFLLALSDPAPPVHSAMRQLKALMPGVPVEARLVEAAAKGGSFWLSFVDLAREEVRKEAWGR